MLTKINPDGTWSVKGIELDECTPEMYNALSRLRDYERTGLNPEDFRDREYERLFLYKVYYSENNEFHTIYCETREDAYRMCDILKSAGCKNVNMNVWRWQAFIEE